MNPDRSRPAVVGAALAALPRELNAAVLRIPERLRHRRFWYIQAMVVVATAVHYGFEISGFASSHDAVHDFAITLYFIPLLYAAMSFGWEGAFMTGLWGAALTSPSTWIWHHSELHWVSEVMQLGVALVIGVVFAWRVDRESKQRRIAERTSASLGLLNKVVETLSHTMEVEQRLPVVIDEIVAALGLQSVVLSLEPETSGAEPMIVVRGTLAACCEAANCPLTRTPQSTKTFDCANDRAVVIALDADGREIGSLAACMDERMGDGRTNLLSTICHEIAVAVENGRLYRQRQEGMQSYVRQVTQAHEDERLRIARELHDETAQELVLLVRRLETFDHETSPVASANAREAVSAARNILKGVRRFSRDLRPSVLDDLGLLAGIEMVVDQNNEILAGGARLRISGEPRRLAPHVEVSLFRIAQEALRNVTKHAHAESAQVRLEFDSDHLTLTVEDDGIGLSLPTNVSDLARLGKLGVLGMKERAELVGGVFEVHPADPHGTVIVVRVPCTPREGLSAVVPHGEPDLAASVVSEADLAMLASAHQQVS